MTVTQQYGKCHSGGKHLQDLPSPPFPRWFRSRPVSDESRMETVTGSHGMAKKRSSNISSKKEKQAAVLIHVEHNGTILLWYSAQWKAPAPVLQHLPPFFYWNHSTVCQKMALYDCCCALKRVFNKISCCYLCLAGKPIHTYWSEQVLRRTGKKTLHRLSHSLHFSLFPSQTVVPATKHEHRE